VVAHSTLCVPPVTVTDSTPNDAVVLLEAERVQPVLVAEPLWQRRTVQLIALVLLVVMGAAARVSSLSISHTLTPDERNYTWEAAALRQNGNAAFVTIIEAFHQDVGIPGPTRAGYLELAALTMRLSGDVDASAVVGLSCAASIISLVLAALLGWRFFSPPVALTAVALYAASPMALMISRRAWEESVAEMFALVLLFLGAEIVHGSTGAAWLGSFAVIGAFTLTIKETSAASFSLIAAGVLAVLWLRRDYRSAKVFGAFCVLASLVAVFWLAHLVGGLRTLQQMSTTTFTFLQTSPYSMEYEAGPPWRLLQGLLLISTMGSLLALASLRYAFTPPRPVPPERQILMGLAAFTILFLLPAAFLPHHLNLRYICVVYGPFYLLAGVGMTRVFAALRSALTVPTVVIQGCLAAAVLLAAGLDYDNFLVDYARPGLQDLSIRMVLSAEGHPLP